MDADVIIVGGGPAGLAASEKIAQENATVIVLEKSSQIGHPVHTTGGSWIRDMRVLGIPEKLYHPVTRCRFVSPNNEVVISYPQKEVCVMDVRGVYQFLAKKATIAGAHIKLKTAVLGPIIQDNYIKGVKARFNDKNLNLYSKIVIDASGVAAIIAQKTGLRGRLTRFGLGAEYELYAPTWNPEESVIILDERIAPCGYGWIVPCGENKVRVGIAIIRPDTDNMDNPKFYLDKLVQDNDKFKAFFRNTKLIEYHFGAIPSAGVNKKFVGNGLMVVGDAAGQPFPLIGEGIRYAIYAGYLAADIAVEAIRKSDYSERFLSKYEKLWKKQYERNHKIAYAINKKIVTFSGEKWDRYLNYLKNMTPKQLVKFFRGEFGIWWALSILFQNPKLSKVVLCEGIKDLLGSVIKRKLRGTFGKRTKRKE